MEGDPFALVEAMTIAAYATGCEKGYVYIRAEYPLAHARLENAIASAHAGLLGDDIMGGVSFDLELRIGAGAYVCGEETALFQSIEGYRGEPRNKPPFPVEVGLFGKPTVVNNVETLFNVLEVVRSGGRVRADRTRVDRHAALLPLGPRRPAGPVRGAVRRRRSASCSSRAGAEPPKAVLLGGAAGAFLRPDAARPAAHLRGRARRRRDASAPVSSWSSTSRPTSSTPLLRIAEFFRDESCGQCVPCRVGTIRQEEALQRLAAGDGRTGTSSRCSPSSRR